MAANHVMVLRPKHQVVKKYIVGAVSKHLFDLRWNHQVVAKHIVAIDRGAYSV